MWHRYAKRTIGWLCSSSSRCKEVQGQPQRDRGRTLGTMCMCEESRVEHTFIERQSWGPLNDSGLRMVNWKSSETPPHSPEDGHIYCTSLIRIVFCHVSKTCHFTAYFTSLWASISVSMLILHVTSSISCLYLLNIYHFTYTFSHAHTKTHTHRHTCMKSRRCDDNQQITVTHFGENKKTAPWEFQTKLLHYFFMSNNKSNLHSFNQQTRGLAATRHRSLVGRGWRKAFVRDNGTHTLEKMSENPDIYES